MNYIATFFSHFGAVRFHRQCQAWAWSAAMRPVPRDLSSSCGTCVYFTTAELPPLKELVTPELEQIVAVEKGYVLLYMVED